MKCLCWVTFLFIILHVISERPPVKERKFISKIVDKVTKEISLKMKDKELAKIFTNTFPNTLDTTVFYDESKNDTFIITGDINAMWLRDSTNQVWPYLNFISQDEKLKKMIQGLITRQVLSVLLDPYANAFYRNEYEGEQTWSSDNTYKLGFLNTKVKAMNSLIHERKYELDSLCALMRLSSGYFDKTMGDITPFNGNWVKSIELILETIREEQKGTIETTNAQKYTFSRQSVETHETLHHGRSCAPNKRCGLSKSYFRPSDDSCKLPYLIPANAMAVATLNTIIPILKKLNHQNLQRDVEKLRDELKDAIQKHGIQNGIFAYETDGFGNAYFTDDANIPSLISLPYLGYISNNDPIYIRTRKFLLSENNPWYFNGKAAKGIGSPHTGLDYIWPMSLTMQALTSNSDDEIIECLEMLKRSTAGTYFMHEGFKKDDAKQFTRSWFAWANTLFGELIYTLSIEKPHLIF